MLEDATQQESNPTPYENGVSPRRKRRGIGCWILIAMWFLLLLAPCAVFLLVVQGEITIWHSNIPDPESHPRFQISLISEAEYRGLMVTSSSINPPNGEQLCLQTDVRFILWEGDADSSRYCDCYIQSATSEGWQFSGSTTGECVAEG